MTVPVAYQNNLSIRADRVREKLCASAGPDDSGIGPPQQFKQTLYCRFLASQTIQRVKIMSVLCLSCDPSFASFAMNPGLKIRYGRGWLMNRDPPQQSQREP